MPATTTYGVDLLVELGIGRAADAGRWGQSDWGQSRWGATDTVTGDWIDVTCDVVDDVRLTAGSNTDDGVTRRWESASAAFTLDGSQWDPWNGPHADVIGDRVPARICWRYPPDPPPTIMRTNRAFNPRGVSPNVNAEYNNRWGWSGIWRTDITDHPAGITTAYRSVAPASPSQGGGRGIDLYGNYEAPVYPTTQPVTPGVPITLSSWVRTGRARTLTITARSHNGAAWVDAASAGPNTVTVAGGWARISRTYVPPAGATHLVARLHIASTDVVAGDYLDTSGLLVEDTDAVGVYFDGSTADLPDLDYAWTGGVNASRSTATTVQHHDGTWTPAFTGFIATRGYAWNPQDQQAAVACVDGTSVLVASRRVASPVAGAGETAAQRVVRLATAALWPGDLDVTAGGTPLLGTTLEDGAWDELLDVADTDLALLWIDRAGALSYRPRGRVGQGVVLAGRLVVCPEGPDDVQVMTLGRNQPSVTRNRVEVARRKDAAVPGDTPAVARLEDRQSIARYQAHDYTRTDLWHQADTWSHTVAQAVLGQGAWPSPAPGELLLDTVTEDPRVPALLLTLEPDMAFDVVDDGGRTYRQAVTGWDMSVRHDGIEAVLYVEDITRWSSVGHWGTALWGVDRWGIGGI